MNKIEQNTIKLGGIDIDSVHIISPNTKRPKQVFGEDWKLTFGMRVSITFDITDRDPQSIRVEIKHEVVGKDVNIDHTRSVFEEDELTPMVELQASTKFEVIPVEGEFIYDERGRPLNFSRNTVVRMINIASGSARGILHVYLRQQGLNKVTMPLVQAERIMENFDVDSAEWGEIIGDE